MTSTRISLPTSGNAVYRAIAALDSSVDFDPALRELVRLRASQINGCAYCVDMHSGDARSGGESERRIWALCVWRETGFFDEREQAALALTEAMTLLPQGVSDEVYANAARHFTDEELANLVGAIISINAWNRVGVGLAMVPPALEVDAGQPTAGVAT